MGGATVGIGAPRLPFWSPKTHLGFGACESCGPPDLSGPGHQLGQYHATFPEPDVGLEPKPLTQRLSMGNLWLRGIPAGLAVHDATHCMAQRPTGPAAKGAGAAFRLQ